MQDAIVIKPFVSDQVKNAMIHGRVIFFSAPCGFGKTTTAWALLEGKKVYFAAAGEPGFRLPLLRETWDVLLLDQLQNLPEEEQEPLCELIRRNPNRRFFLLSRGTPASCWCWMPEPCSSTGTARPSSFDSWGAPPQIWRSRPFSGSPWGILWLSP